uniref:Rhodopsin domain-containing protein n=1 Tax=Bionectria ochroleuca TaxID=29856 RepID=A0A0B7KJX1_BIOOC
MTFVLEICTITCIWTVKACLLILYSRLMRHAFTRQHMLVKIVAGYCVITYLVVIFMFLFYWCNPIYEYWAIPVRIDQCATYYHHMIFATACNISSDILLLLIPIPIISKTQMPTKRKVFLICILGLGVFNILAAILNRYYNFSNPNSSVFLYWYVAEVGMAILVGNMPLCWPVLKAIFGLYDKSDTPSSHGYTFSSGSGNKKKPNIILSRTVPGATMWDRLSEQEEAAASSQGPSNHHPPSDQGSEIELIRQGHTDNHHHRAAISANRESPDQPSKASKAVGPGDSSSHTRPTGDKIMVDTTVDISSTGSRV